MKGASLHCRNQQKKVYGTNLEFRSSSEHRLHGFHAIVVVVLGGELLRTQSVGGNNLD